MGIRKGFIRSRKRNQEREKALQEELERLEEFRESQKDSSTDTALHLACEHHYSDDLIIDILIKPDPNCLGAENGAGDLPLHSAMKDVKEVDGHKGVSEQVLDNMIQLDRDAAKHFNKNHCLPIHIACEYGANDYAVKKLLNVHPQAAMSQCSINKLFDKSSAIFTEVEEGGDSMSNICNLTCCDLDAIFPSVERKDSDTNDEDHFETHFSPLHLAIINNASPNVVDYIINANPKCLYLETSKGRKAIDIAKSRPDTNLDVIHVLQTYSNNAEKILNLGVLSDSIIRQASRKSSISSGGEIFDAKSRWKATVNAVIFANRLAAALGPTLALDDNDDVKLPYGFKPPASLENSCVDVKLPVGFRQLRAALLSSKSGFNKEFHEQEMKYSE